MEPLLSFIALLVELAFYVCVMIAHALVAIFHLIVYLVQRCVGRASNRVAAQLPPTAGPHAPTPRPRGSTDSGSPS